MYFCVKLHMKTFYLEFVYDVAMHLFEIHSPYTDEGIVLFNVDFLVSL